VTEHLLSTLGLALRAGAVAVGEEPVGAAARAKKARVIFTARDAAASSVRRAYSFGRAGSCLCLPFPADKETFGRALGRTSVAMCAVTDIGFAQSLVKKLAAAEPEIYGAAAEALDLKAKQARERKEEQLQHEKNLRQGRHRVHGGKPPEPPHASPEPPAPEHRPPAPEWGYMLNEGRACMQSAPWMMIFPGLAIFLVVTVFNMLGDSVRDILDPKEA